MAPTFLAHIDKVIGDCKNEGCPCMYIPLRDGVWYKVRDLPEYEHLDFSDFEMEFSAELTVLAQNGSITWCNKFRVYKMGTKKSRQLAAAAKRLARAKAKIEADEGEIQPLQNKPKAKRTGSAPRSKRAKTSGKAKLPTAGVGAKRDGVKKVATSAAPKTKKRK